MNFILKIEWLVTTYRNEFPYQVHKSQRKRGYEDIVKNG